ncbi:hypothetical protein ABT56_07650 [Photobacterium aquae]|uniref:PepSY domain-containing protein n=1 Tax=Photobacterium aquae TaxID=1195763 RepID=A0A0J1H5N3_9GAMM|nr:PepSY domain-containing protein [Photobacterium aquae]KLV07011.1 hypothetical protein ABT56_07650 [Photobacterium aquae]
MKSNIAIMGLVMGSIMAMSAHADPVEPPSAPALTVPKAMRMLQAEGYYDFRKIKVEQDDHEIEIEARNPDGMRVEVELDLFSGRILSVERD